MREEISKEEKIHRMMRFLRSANPLLDRKKEIVKYRRLFFADNEEGSSNELEPLCSRRPDWPGRAIYSELLS